VPASRGFVKVDIDIFSEVVLALHLLQFGFVCINLGREFIEAALVVGEISVHLTQLALVLFNFSFDLSGPVSWRGSLAFVAVGESSLA
jgi:hypothetical protein